MSVDAQGFLADLRKEFRSRQVTIKRPTSVFPELLVKVPDSWATVQIAPLYDVHLGHKHHDEALFKKHVQWIARTPNVLTFDGGDLFDNSSKLSVGGGVYEQSETPNEQVYSGMEAIAPIQHKMLFKLPGNHEQRSGQMGLDVAQWVSTGLALPYFSDYCVCVIEWRGLRFRILAHHGSGAATTAGAQRMAARKDLTWAKPIDLYWTGHLHNPLVDVLYQTDADQKTGLLYERNAFVLISPSYLGFFGTYAAMKRYHPGTRGLASVTLNDDGRMDATMHARGQRL